jgi:Asp-tRNA(Asn)/Glu-tRNA(Gln) amidotransferase A subunit family amidase
VSKVHGQTLKPIDILRTYGKVAIRAHEKTNCLTEILFPEAEEWISSGEINLNGPLAGIPVSLKDSIAVRGFDVTVGYSRYAGQPYAEDGTLVRLLKDAGMTVQPHSSISN